MSGSFDGDDRRDLVGTLRAVISEVEAYFRDVDRS
jgi:hypothetical protein